MSDESADVTGGAERAELRTLLRSAVRGLNAGEQDLIELQLRQELDVTEIAAVLGVSRNHAHALLSRARTQLAQGAVMSGPGGFPEPLDPPRPSWQTRPVQGAAAAVVVVAAVLTILALTGARHHPQRRRAATVPRRSTPPSPARQRPRPARPLPRRRGTG